ncbi:MAG TPA: homospermidine synthase [Enhygromyxa sp.]|nr:homospermidine synthase [Enhygromyxa sp.]
MLPGQTELLLVDGEGPQPHVPMPRGARWLPAATITSASELAELVAEHRIEQVIELAAVDTWDCLEACAAAGASFLTTTFDTWEGTEQFDPDDPFCMLRARGLFSPPDVDYGTHLVCMGMNPGLVNLLVAAGLRELAERTNRPASLAALEVESIVFTELDETTVDGERSPGEPPRFCSTWSPEGCLDEILEPYAMINVAGELTRLDHAPHRARYRGRCGDQQIVGYLVPHEELVSLGAMYPTVELAYLYRPPPAGEAALTLAPERRIQDWPTRRLYPPEHGDDLRGFNRIGALIGTRSLGELWIGWETPVELGRQYSSNATLLQVAAGVIVGWTLAQRLDPGIYLPEDLDTRRALGLAAEILGAPRVVWDRDAPALGVLDRRVD